MRTPDPTSPETPGPAARARRRIVSPGDLADSARRAAREALAAYDGPQSVVDGVHGVDERQEPEL
ncbi:hypothetical protein ACRAWF_07155 [Streptomyces sp. L7]